MEVFFSDIPNDGLHLEGEFPATIFDLDPADTIRSTGPARYEADIYAFEEVIVLNGHLRGPFQLQCGACLEYFDYTADFPHWSAEVDREPGQKSFELSEVVREDFLLGLPSHPRCDEFIQGRVCPKAGLVEEFTDQGEAEVEEAPGRDVWGALDDLKI